MPDFTRWKEGHHSSGYTSAYGSWCAVKKRCNDPNSPDYKKWYGSKGITLDTEWAKDFDAFFTYMGPCPEGQTLDRWPNNSGNYEPGNVRWATDKEQQRNRTNNFYVTYQGEEKLFIEFVEENNLNYQTAYGRLQKGASLEDLFLEIWPPRPDRYITFCDWKRIKQWLVCTWHEKDGTQKGPRKNRYFDTKEEAVKFRDDIIEKREADHT